MSISGQISQEAAFFSDFCIGRGSLPLWIWTDPGSEKGIPGRAHPHRTGRFFLLGLCGCCFFLITFLENSGMVRGFSLAGMCFGMFLYYKMLDRLVVAVFAEILHILFYPIRFMTKKTGTFFRKILKMCKKKVTMSISKAKGKQTGRVKNEKKKKTQK